MLRVVSLNRGSTSFQEDFKKQVVLTIAIDRSRLSDRHSLGTRGNIL
jgi:hypothetical protein